MTRFGSPLGIRARLLVTIALALVVALTLITVASNVILRRSLDGDARSLVHARAAAALSTVRVQDGHVSVAESPDDDAIDAQVWVFNLQRQVEGPSPSPAALDRAAETVAGGPAKQIDARGTLLYAVPIVQDGSRVGTLVAGVGMRAYRQTARTALIGSIGLALVLFLLAVAASRWILRRALLPVSQMTRAAIDWSEHTPDRRFARGEPYDELSSLAATLDTLLDRLANSLRHEQRFSAEMSHELRTPLARIHGEVELALSRPRSTDEHRAALAAIGRSAEQMTRTVDALVAVARQAGSSSRASSDAREALARAIEATRPPSLRGGVTPVLEAPRTPIRIAAEADVVERIVAPLLENARRHAATRATVAVARSGSTVTITVSDDGPGVDADELEAIFQPGARESANGAGAGLGLALARRLARAAGGDVAAFPGPGGCFIASLPVA